MEGCEVGVHLHHHYHFTFFLLLLLIFIIVIVIVIGITTIIIMTVIITPSTFLLVSFPITHSMYGPFSHSPILSCSLSVFEGILGERTKTEEPSLIAALERLGLRAQGYGPTPAVWSLGCV